MFGFRLIAVEHTYTNLGLYWQFVCLMNFGSTKFLLMMHSEADSWISNEVETLDALAYQVKITLTRRFAAR